MAEGEESEGILQGRIQGQEFEGFLVFPDLLPYNGPGKASSACPGGPAGCGLERTKLSGAPCGFILPYSLGLMVSLVPRPNTSSWPAPESHPSKELYINCMQGPSLPTRPLSPLKRSLLCSQCPSLLGPQSLKPESFRTVSLCYPLPPCQCPLQQLQACTRVSFSLSVKYLTSLFPLHRSLT